MAVIGLAGPLVTGCQTDSGTSKPSAATASSEVASVSTPGSDPYETTSVDSPDVASVSTPGSDPNETTSVDSLGALEVGESCLTGLMLVSGYGVVGLVSGIDPEATEQARQELDALITAASELSLTYPDDVRVGLEAAAERYAGLRGSDASEDDWNVFQEDVSSLTQPFLAWQDGQCAPILKAGGVCQPVLQSLLQAPADRTLEGYRTFLPMVAEGLVSDSSCASALAVSPNSPSSSAGGACTADHLETLGVSDETVLDQETAFPMSFVGFSCSGDWAMVRWQSEDVPDVEGRWLIDLRSDTVTEFGGPMYVPIGALTCAGVPDNDANVLGEGFDRSEGLVCAST